jgi:hypothetical protein
MGNFFSQYHKIQKYISQDLKSGTGTYSTLEENFFVSFKNVFEKRIGSRNFRPQQTVPDGHLPDIIADPEADFAPGRGEGGQGVARAQRVRLAEGDLARDVCSKQNYLI